MRYQIPDVPALFKMWHGGVDIQDIAAHFDVSCQTIYNARHTYGLPKRPKKRWQLACDPTPEEIRERSLAIREKNMARMREQG
jgi:hypothetical protein